MFGVLPLCEGIDDLADVVVCQFIVVRDLYAFIRRVDKEDTCILPALFQDHDAGHYRGAEEEVCRQLDDAVDVVVVDKVLPDLLLRTAPVHDAGEADDGRHAVRGKPGKGVHDEGQVRLALGREHACGREPGVVDQEGIVIPGPLDTVRGIGDDQFKGLVVPVLRGDKRILAGDVELIEIDVMQVHVDTAEVVCGDVDLLSEEALADMVLAQDLCRLQEEGPGPTGRVVYLVDFRLPYKPKQGQEAADFLSIVFSL